MNRSQARHGPEFRPVSREERVREWAQAIQAMLRHDDSGAAIADAVALSCADQFWESLERKFLPLKDIMAIDGAGAVRWVLSAYAGLVEGPPIIPVQKPEDPQEEPMAKSGNLAISVGPEDGKTSTYRILNITVRIKEDSGEYRMIPVYAEVEIDHASLRRLVQKAADNKSKKSSDGPLTVRVDKLSDERKEGNNQLCP